MLFGSSLVYISLEPWGQSKPFLFSWSIHRVCSLLPILYILVLELFLNRNPVTQNFIIWCHYPGQDHACSHCDVIFWVMFSSVFSQRQTWRLQSFFQFRLNLRPNLKSTVFLITLFSSMSSKSHFNVFRVFQGGSIYDSTFTLPASFMVPSIEQILLKISGYGLTKSSTLLSSFLVLIYLWTVSSPLIVHWKVY